MRLNIQFEIAHSTTIVGRSQWPRGVRRMFAAARLWVRIPPGAWTFVSFECCQRSLWRADHSSYQLWCVVVWYRNLVNEEAMAHGWVRGGAAPKTNYYCWIQHYHSTGISDGTMYCSQCEYSDNRLYRSNGTFHCIDSLSRGSALKLLKQASWSSG